MKALAEELISILSAQMALYERVGTLLEEERAALTSQKPDSALALVRRKETILLQIKTLEEGRRLVCARLASGWGASAASLTLGAIAERLEGPLGRELGSLRERLRECVERLRTSNDKNARACETGIDLIRRIAGQAVGSGAPAAGPRNAAGAAKAQRAYGGAR